MHNIMYMYCYIGYTIYWCNVNLEESPWLPVNNLVLVSVNDIDSFMTILILTVFSFESNKINLDLLSNDAQFCKYMRFAL